MHLQLDQLSEARAAWRHAIALEPANREKLKDGLDYLEKRLGKDEDF